MRAKTEYLDKDGIILYFFDKQADIVDGAWVDSPIRRERARRAAELELRAPVSARDVDEVLDDFETIPEQDADLSRARRSDVWKILELLGASEDVRN